MSKLAIRKMINTYLKDVLEGYSIIASDKYPGEKGEIISEALEKLMKKMSKKINQDELLTRIEEVVKTKAKRPSRSRKSRTKKSSPKKSSPKKSSPSRRRTRKTTGCKDGKVKRMDKSGKMRCMKP
jgi:hypothetical protein